MGFGGAILLVENAGTSVLCAHARVSQSRRCNRQSSRAGDCHGSDQNREVTGGAGFFLGICKALTGRKPEDGAWTYVDAAVVKGKESSHGYFCENWEIHPSVTLACSMLEDH